MLRGGIDGIDDIDGIGIGIAGIGGSLKTLETLDTNWPPRSNQHVCIPQKYASWRIGRMPTYHYHTIDIGHSVNQCGKNP